MVHSSREPDLRGWAGVEGSIWVQDGNRILEITDEGLHPVERVNALSGIVLSTQFEKDGKFWVTTSQGAAHHAPPLWQTPAGIRQLNDVVNGIAEDRSGKLWFSTATSLVMFDNQH